MSTKIGIITEGVIDDILLPVLLQRIARDRANFTWPIMPDDLGRVIPLRKRGHGGVLDAVRKLVAILERNPPEDHAFIVILLDRRTQAVQKEIRRLISGKHLFVLGIAIEELEAWWLADRKNTLAWLGFHEQQGETHLYWKSSYKPEKDPAPKKTLDQLTEMSPRLEHRYGEGNAELAREFAEDFWKENADLDRIERDCHKGFRPFCRVVTQKLRHEKSGLGILPF